MRRSSIWWRRWRFCSLGADEDLPCHANTFDDPWRASCNLWMWIHLILLDKSQSVSYQLRHKTFKLSQSKVAAQLKKRYTVLFRYICIADSHFPKTAVACMAHWDRSTQSKKSPNVIACTPYRSICFLHQTHSNTRLQSHCKALTRITKTIIIYLQIDCL